MASSCKSGAQSAATVPSTPIEFTLFVLNTESLAAVDDARWSERFLRPLYESFCFSRIPGTIEHILTGSSPLSTLPPSVFGDGDRRARTVVFFLVDAFGWRFLERWRSSVDLLAEIAECGVVSKLTSMFPSTTAVHVTCAHTGLPIKQSGVCEWQYYDPRVGEVILPLLYRAYSSKLRDSLPEMAGYIDALLPRGELYDRLAERGVRSYVFQSALYARSAYSRHVCRGARTIPYRNLREGLERLRETVEEESDPAYCFFYIDRFDLACHEHGPASTRLDRFVRTLFGSIERHVLSALRGRPDTLYLLSADHGQVEMDPGRTVYLDVECPRVAGEFARDVTGGPIAPAGSSRDYFIYLRDASSLPDVQGELRAVLDGRAEVYSRAELEDAGMFGPGEASAGFDARMPDLIALPYANESVYWLGKPERPQQFRGHHGGLTPEEMETVLVAWRT